MNTPELIDAVAGVVNMTNKDVRKVIQSVVNTVQSEMSAGSQVVIMGLGKFYVSRQPRKKLRNPRTQAVIVVPARKIVKFTTSRLLKESVL